MEKKIAIIVSCLVAYLLLRLIIGSTINLILIGGFLVYGMYKVSR